MRIAGIEGGENLTELTEEIRTVVCLVGQNSENLDDSQPDSFVWGFIVMVKGLDFRVRFVTVSVRVDYSINKMGKCPRPANFENFLEAYSKRK